MYQLFSCEITIFITGTVSDPNHKPNRLIWKRQLEHSNYYSLPPTIELMHLGKYTHMIKHSIHKT